MPLKEATNPGGRSLTAERAFIHLLEDLTTLPSLSSTAIEAITGGEFHFDEDGSLTLQGHPERFSAVRLRSVERGPTQLLIEFSEIEVARSSELARRFGPGEWRLSHGAASAPLVLGYDNGLCLRGDVGAHRGEVAIAWVELNGRVASCPDVMGHRASPEKAERAAAWPPRSASDRTARLHRYPVLCPPRDGRHGTVWLSSDGSRTGGPSLSMSEPMADRSERAA